MTNEEIKERIQELSLKYPDLDIIEIDYNGSGDCFDSMYSNTDGVEYSDYEDLVWALIEKSDANFNDEGSEGDIVIDLKNKTAKIQNYHIIYQREAGDKITIE